jgi:hypothetical protein
MEEFNKLLEEYRGNYVQFLTTGIPDYERAYKNAQNAIEGVLVNMGKRVEKEKKDMKHFSKSYAQDNNELENLYNSASAMYTDAQTIQDNYETSKQQYNQFIDNPTPSSAVDVTNGYNLLLRIGIILVLIPVLFVVGYYIVSQPSQPAPTYTISLPSD